MRVILAGTRSFGRVALETLVDTGHDVAYAVAPADDKVHWRAKTLGVDARTALHHDEVAAAKADLIVCAHSHQFVGRKSRAATALGALVGHPSLLPRHRGRSAVEWTTRMRDPIAGFTWFWADNGVDTGPIAWQDWCHVNPQWDHHQLWERLFPMGQRGLVQVMAELRQGRYVQLPQDNDYATREPAIEATPLYRPELIEIGPGPAGFTHIASAEHPEYRQRG